MWFVYQSNFAHSLSGWLDHCSGCCSLWPPEPSARTVRDFWGRPPAQEKGESHADCKWQWMVEWIVHVPNHHVWLHSQDDCHPPFTRAPRPGFEPGFESGFDSNRPGYVHTGSGILVVNDVTTGVKYTTNNWYATAIIMAATAMIAFFLCFGLLSMVWLKQRRRMRIRRRRRSILARRVRTAAFCASQEAELRAAVTALATDLLLRSSVHRRSVWMRNRSQAFMQVISAWDDLEWKRNFRVSRATYRHLCNELQTKVQHDSSIRETVVVEKRVAIALWRLGTNVEYRTISHLFGVGMSTACNIVHEVCKAIVDSLLEKYITIPRGNAAMDVVRGFEEKWGFPQCFGAVDGSHIPIIPPHDCPTDYFNRKGFPLASPTLHLVLDRRCFVSFGQRWTCTFSWKLLFSVDIARACAESRALPARRQSSDIQHCS